MAASEIIFVVDESSEVDFDDVQCHFDESTRPQIIRFISS
jgi:hypothetical protein